MSSAVSKVRPVAVANNTLLLQFKEQYVAPILRVDGSALGEFLRETRAWSERPELTGYLAGCALPDGTIRLDSYSKATDHSGSGIDFVSIATAVGLRDSGKTTIVHVRAITGHHPVRREVMQSEAVRAHLEDEILKASNGKRFAAEVNLDSIGAIKKVHSTLGLPNTFVAMVYTLPLYEGSKLVGQVVTLGFYDADHSLHPVPYTVEMPTEGQSFAIAEL